MNKGFDGKYTKNFTNFFNKFKKEEITADSKQTFHSIRHSFVSNLMNQSNIPTELVDKIIGHAGAGETVSRYFKPDQESMLEVMKKLDYGFDLFDIFDFTPVSDSQVKQQLKLVREAELCN